MDIGQVLEALDFEIERLQKVRVIVAGVNGEPSISSKPKAKKRKVVKSQEVETDPLALRNF